MFLDPGQKRQLRRDVFLRVAGARGVHTASTLHANDTVGRTEIAAVCLMRGGLSPLCLACRLRVGRHTALRSSDWLYVYPITFGAVLPLEKKHEDARLILSFLL